MKKEVIVRVLNPNEVEFLPEVVESIWRPLSPNTEDEWWEEAKANPENSIYAKQYNNNPKGYLVAEVEGKIVGQFSSTKLNYDLNNPIPLWYEVSGHEIFDNHDENGDTVYGQSLGVNPEYRGFKVGEKLAKGLQELCRKENCKRVVLGCRIPNYHLHQDMPVEEYIQMKREDGEYYDPELRFYSRCGYHFGKPLPEYMSGEYADPESLNYGVLTIWDNPDYEEK